MPSCTIPVEALNEALTVVATVTPSPIQGSGAGYLFTVDGGICRVYSQDNIRKIRTQIDNVSGDTGSFILPTDRVSVFKYLEGNIQFEYGHTEDQYWVKYNTEGGAEQQLSTYDPDLVQPFDDVVPGPDAFPAAVLKECLNSMKTFMGEDSDGRVSEANKVIQLFDGEVHPKANGHFYASNKLRSAYFFCDAFVDQKFAIHGQHLPALLAFLGKCDGLIRVTVTPTQVYVTNAKNQVFGWAKHTKQYDTFSYYSYKSDQFILQTPKDQLLKALRFVRAAVDVRKDKVRIQYTHADQTLQFVASTDASKKITSVPITVKAIVDEKGGGERGVDTDFAYTLSINYLLDLIDPIKGHSVTLRVSEVADSDGAYFRTIEEFLVNDQGRCVISPKDSEKVHTCRVTRFMPSRK